MVFCYLSATFNVSQYLERKLEGIAQLSKFELGILSLIDQARWPGGYSKSNSLSVLMVMKSRLLKVQTISLLLKLWECLNLNE